MIVNGSGAPNPITSPLSIADRREARRDSYSRVVISCAERREIDVSDSRTSRASFRMGRLTGKGG